MTTKFYSTKIPMLSLSQQLAVANFPMFTVRTHKITIFLQPTTAVVTDAPTPSHAMLPGIFNVIDSGEHSVSHTTTVPPPMVFQRGLSAGRSYQKEGPPNTHYCHSDSGFFDLHTMIEKNYSYELRQTNNLSNCCKTVHLHTSARSLSILLLVGWLVGWIGFV